MYLYICNNFNHNEFLKIGEIKKMRINICQESTYYIVKQDHGEIELMNNTGLMQYATNIYHVNVDPDAKPVHTAENAKFIIETIMNEHVEEITFN